MMMMVMMECLHRGDGDSQQDALIKRQFGCVVNKLAVFVAPSAGMIWNQTEIT
jgi:hypothetical protein